MYSDGLLKLPIFTIQKDFKILLTVYSLSPHSFSIRMLSVLQASNLKPIAYFPCYAVILPYRDNSVQCQSSHP